MVFLMFGVLGILLSYFRIADFNPVIPIAAAAIYIPMVITVLSLKGIKISFLFGNVISGISLVVISLVFNSRFQLESNNHQGMKRIYGDTVFVKYRIEEVKRNRFGFQCIAKTQIIKHNIRFIPESWAFIFNVYFDSGLPAPEPGRSYISKAILLPFQDPVFPKEFSWKEYNHRRGIFAKAKMLNIKQSHEESKMLFRFSGIEKIRELIRRVTSLTGDKDRNRNIILAMVLGEKTGMHKDVKSVFSKSGVMHILAVSGLHVGIIYLILGYLLKLVGLDDRKKIAGVILVVAGIWAYAILTGLSPSVSRASLMFTLIALGRSFRRSYGIYNILACSALILLLLNPFLLFDVGFQLSYAALTGIVSVFPLLKGLLYFKFSFLQWMWSFLCVTVGAQVGTLPVALYYFEQFPNFFAITNFIAVPSATAILAGSIMCIGFHKIPILFDLLRYLLNLLLDIVFWILDWFSSLTYAISEVSLHTWEVFWFYALIILILFTLNLGSKKLFFTFFISLLFGSMAGQYQRSMERGSELLSLIRYKNALFVDFMDAGKRRKTILLKGDPDLYEELLERTRSYSLSLGIKEEFFQQMDSTANYDYSKRCGVRWTLGANNFYAMDGRKMCHLKNGLRNENGNNYLIIRNKFQLSRIPEEIQNSFRKVFCMYCPDDQSIDNESVQCLKYIDFIPLKVTSHEQ